MSTARWAATTGTPSFFACLPISSSPARGFGGGSRHAGRGVRRVLHAVVVAVHADQHFDLVVVRRDVFVVERPVEAEPVARVRLEIVRAVAQRDAAPVIGAAAEHARAPPPEALLFVFRCVRVRLARNLPAALDGGIVEAEFLVGRRRAAQRRLVGRVEHRRLGLGHVVAARFEHQDLRAVHRERVRRLAARRAGADDDHVVLLLQVASWFRVIRHGGYLQLLHADFSEQHHVLVVVVLQPEVTGCGAPAAVRLGRALLLRHRIAFAVVGDLLAVHRHDGAIVGQRDLHRVPFLAAPASPCALVSEYSTPVR